MIKLCFIISSLCNEGPVNVMYNIIQYIDFSKFKVSVITLTPEKDNTRFDEFQKLSIEIRQLAERKKKNPFALFCALKKTIQDINPDMLHAHCPRSLYLMSFLPHRYKRIYTIHIYPGLQQKILYGQLKGSIIIRLNNYFTHKTDMPIGCAESVGKLYKKIQGWDILSIPNGSSLPLWNEDIEYKQKLRNDLKLQRGVFYFIYIGRFSKEKNPDILINTFKQLARKDIGLIMLGNGPLWEKLKEEESDRIILPGFKTNIYEYLIASDIYISASDVEGLANTLLESMTIGLPMLLSNIPSHKEVLSKTNKTVGFVFNPTDSHHLTDQIEHIISLNKDDVKKEVQRIFNQYYTAEKMSLAYQKAYSDLYTKQLMKK